MDVIRFTVNERPQSQGSISGGHHRNPKLKKFRESVGYMALFAMADAGEHEPFTGPILLELDFYFPRPKSVPESEIFPIHVHIPDLDHIQRAIGDACEGVVWENDRQIVDCHARKWYGTPERVEVVIRQAAVTSPAGEF